MVNEWESVRVELRSKTGVTTTVEFVAGEGEPIRGELDVNTEKIETTWDGPEFPAYRTFKPGKMRGSLSIGGPIAKAGRVTPPRPSDSVVPTV